MKKKDLAKLAFATLVLASSMSAKAEAAASNTPASQDNKNNGSTGHSCAAHGGCAASSSCAAGSNKNNGARGHSCAAHSCGASASCGAEKGKNSGAADANNNNNAKKNSWAYEETDMSSGNNASSSWQSNKSPMQRADMPSQEGGQNPGGQNQKPNNAKMKSGDSYNRPPRPQYTSDNGDDVRILPVPDDAEQKNQQNRR